MSETPLMEPVYVSPSGAPFPSFRGRTSVRIALAHQYLRQPSQGRPRTPLVGVQAARACPGMGRLRLHRLHVRGGRAPRFGAGGRAGTMAWEGRELVSACSSGDTAWERSTVGERLFARFHRLARVVAHLPVSGIRRARRRGTNCGLRKIREPVNIIRPFICVLFVRPSFSQPSQRAAFHVSLTYGPPTFVINIES